MADANHIPPHHPQDYELLMMGIFGKENNVILADSVMICDANGNVLCVHESYENYFGVTPDYVIGKNVFDLEQEGIFYPSVTRMVIQQRQRVVTTQRNRDGTLILTTGIPIFQENGEIRFIVCFNALDVIQLQNLQEKYNQLKVVLEHKSEEVQALRQKYLKPEGLLYRSKVMQSMWECAMQVASSNANILITGETGVGKNMVAKEIHFASKRADGPFVEINCATLHENLIESELFGYEKGAFTGANTTGKIGKIELANHGTLFLDEIGELPMSAQAKLLDVIQNKTFERISGNKRIIVDFRLIAATNRDLKKDVEDGRFRKDLYYRLNVARIHIPPLRDRKSDIAVLAVHFLQHFNQEYQRNITFSPQFLDFVDEYSWPGNVRELENLIERMVITCTGNVLDVEFLPIDFVRDLDLIPHHISKKTLPEMVEEYEKKLIQNSMKRYKTTIAVAEDLGISQATASRKINRYFGDETPQEESPGPEKA